MIWVTSLRWDRRLRSWGYNVLMPANLSAHCPVTEAWGWEIAVFARYSSNLLILWFYGLQLFRHYWEHNLQFIFVSQGKHWSKYWPWFLFILQVQCRKGNFTYVCYKIQTNIGKHFYLWNVFKRITMFDLILNVTDGVKKLSFKSHLDSEFCKVCHFHKIYFSWNLFSPPRHLPSRGCRQETIGPSVFSFPSVTQGVVVVVDTEPHRSLRKMTGWRRLKVDILGILSCW